MDMALKASEIGERLKRARDGARLSLPFAAKASHLTDDQLVEAEEGRGLTVERVRRIAETYGLAEEELLAEEFSDSAVSVLLRAETASEELALHLGRFAAICREHTLLDELLGQATRGKVTGFAPAGPPTKPTYRQAEDLARNTREQLKLGTAPVRSMSGLMEELGIRLVWTDALPEEVQGLSFNDRRMGPSVVANLRGRVGQWWTLRSTLAHELCHILYDRVPAQPLGIASRKDQKDDLESRANAFAVYFLAPREGVQQLLRDRGRQPYGLDHQDVHTLMMHFGVGKDSATRHLTNLDWITAEQRQELLGRRYPTEPDDDVESPFCQSDLRAFRDLGVHLERLGLVRPAVTAYERGLITRGRLLESLGLSPFAPIDPLVEGPSV